MKSKNPNEPVSVHSSSTRALVDAIDAILDHEKKDVDDAELNTLFRHLGHSLQCLLEDGNKIPFWIHCNKKHDLARAMLKACSTGWDQAARLIWVSSYLFQRLQITCFDPDSDENSRRAAMDVFKAMIHQDLPGVMLKDAAHRIAHWMPLSRPVDDELCYALQVS